MTQLLEKAFTEVTKLPEQEQDLFADWILKEITSERRWKNAFAKSEDLLARLADEALNEYRNGRTIVLDAESI